MYRKVPTDMNFAQREEAVAAFWRDERIMERAWEAREGGPGFTLYDGPPTANGRPHVGHLLTRAIKDVIPRHRTMKGYHVEFKAGWDTHGLPVELEVEKSLGINSKSAIEAYGVEPFVEACKHSVWTYKDEWERISDRFGYWADMEHPYVTYDNDYIESEWWALKKIWERDLLYEGHKIVPYCPRCGTSLSSHEVAQGYKDLTDDSVYVRFAVEGEEDTYFAAWTTTPWTLPSNAALCVNPEARYLRVVTPHGRHYVAAARAEALFGEGVEADASISGAELVGKRYRPLFDFARGVVEASGRDAWYVVADDYVTLEDGTGIVHIAPAFGEDDARIGRERDLPFIQLVAENGNMTDEVSGFAGVFCMDANPGLVELLDETGQLIRIETIEHAYPHCWRCATPLIYYARHGWFIRMTAVRDELVRNNRTVNWIPETIRDGRFGHFLENVIDWALSRDRYWGTPLPVWVCEQGHQHAVGSIAELREMSPDCPDEIELHKPWIDQVHLNCPHCGELMTRVHEVIDGWFDSGAMPFAQYHYPFENKERFEANFPADFISEGQDQTRGWFYSLMAISTLLFDRSPYENVIVMGLVQDKDGVKMSKHLGNVIDPWDVLERQGADAARWYFYTGSQPWLPSRFSMEAVAEGQRKFLGTLWNSYAFYIMYAQINGFSPVGLKLEDQALTVMDRWILSRLQGLVREVDEGLERYDITGPGRRMAAFVEELSNWYVRSGRERYWGPEMTADKQAAYLTLYTVLETLTRLAAPFVPFVTEQIYQNLVRSVDPDAPLSVHHCDYPVVAEAWIDRGLEARMDEVLRLVGLGRAARQERQVKTRQPLAEMLVVSDMRLDEEDSRLVTEELNVKRLRYIDDASQLQDYRFKPQLRTLGRRLGRLLPLVSERLAELDGRRAWATLEAEGRMELEVDGETVTLERDDLIVETAPLADFATLTEQERTVALDLRLDQSLVEEGLVRELISKIQTMRRESDFHVTDRIAVSYHCGDTLAQVIARHGEAIAAEVLARELHALDEPARAEGARDWSINGHACQLLLEA